MVRLKAKTTPMVLDRTLVLSLGQRRVRLPNITDQDVTLLRALIDGVGAQALRDLTIDSRTTAFIRALETQGMLEHETSRPPSDIADADLARFDRLVHFFAEFETDEVTRYDFLRRLLRARVAVIGVGGMGSWVAFNLACCGVGSLVLVDPDEVEASNLNRAILFAESDVGRLKVGAGAETLKRFAPRVDVRTEAKLITGAEDVVAAVAGCDLIVGCADQPLWRIRHWIAQAARRLNVAVLQANGGSVGPLQLPDGQSSCTMCVWAATVERHPQFPSVVAAQRLLPRRTSGAVSPGPSFSSAVVTMEALRYLAGYTRPMTVDAVWEADLTTFASQVRPRPPHPRCPVCSGVGPGADAPVMDP